MYTDTALKILTAFILGGIVGFEREYKSRPAGLRTHMLVCVGAALVQIVSINFFKVNHGTSGDPMRLGAQVISGIGFLGAGTIIKEGTSIKGLTTAASIWTVGCIGLAAGAGLYAEAAFATFIVYISLRGFKRIEDFANRGKRYSEIQIIGENVPGQLGQIGTAFGALGIQITNVKMYGSEEELINICFMLKIPYEVENDRIIDKLVGLKGIREINFI